MLIPMNLSIACAHPLLLLMFELYGLIWSPAQADRDCQLAMRLQSQENKQRQEDDKKFQKLQVQFLLLTHFCNALYYLFLFVCCCCCVFFCKLTLTYVGGDVAQLIVHWTSLPPAQVRFPCAARDFSLRVKFQCRLTYRVHTLLCAVACIYLCAHARDPVVHVRVRWVIETLKHPACTLGLVVWLLQLVFPGEGNLNSHGRNPIGTIQL